MASELCQVVLLPEQLDRLASLARQTGKAVGVSQGKSSTLHINTGDAKFDIDARGNNIEPPNQESLC